MLDNTLPVTSARVQLCKTRFMSFQSRLVYVLSQKEAFVPLSPFLPVRIFLRALPSQTVLEILSQWHNTLCHFIMDCFLAG